MTHRFSFPFAAKPLRFGMYTLMVSIGLVAGFGGVFSGTGCGGDCMLDSDCGGDLICAYQFCHIACTQPSDCNTERQEVCFQENSAPGKVRSYCGTPVDCTTNAECGLGQVCDGSKCRDECRRDMDCFEWQKCTATGCVDKTTQLDVPLNTKAVPGTACKIHIDCASQNCNDSLCVGCVENFDCGEVRTCEPAALENTGRCVGGGVTVGPGFEPWDCSVVVKCVWHVCSQPGMEHCCTNVWDTLCTDEAFKKYGTDCGN